MVWPAINLGHFCCEYKLIRIPKLFSGDMGAIMLTHFININKGNVHDGELHEKTFLNNEF